MGGTLVEGGNHEFGLELEKFEMTVRQLFTHVREAVGDDRLEDLRGHTCEDEL